MDTTVAPLASIGVDIGKEVFHLVGFGTDGKIAFRRKIRVSVVIFACPVTTEVLGADTAVVETAVADPDERKP